MNFYSFYAFLSIAFVSFSTGMQLPPANQGMQVKIFNVGQGSCAVVTYPGQPSLLVDAGSSQLPVEGKDTAIAQIASHINTYSQNGLCVILSHPNIDHYNWLPDILAKVSNHIPRNLTFGGRAAGYNNSAQILQHVNTELIRDSSQLLQNTSQLPSYCSILHPGIIDSKNDNDQSIIVSVEDLNFRVILPGDAAGKTLDTIIFPPHNKKTYFVASHHGASNHGANSYAALQALKPEAIIISSGMHAGHQHPTAAALSNFVATTKANHPSHALLAQSNKNIFGENNAPTIANYTGGFSLYHTNHPVYTTNNASTVTVSNAGISAQNLTSTDNAQNVLHAIGRNYFTNFNLNTIKHLFLAGMNITDGHVQQLATLPHALSYFDLQNNKISAHGFTHLLSILENRFGRLTIKTSGNTPTDINVLKPLLQQNAASQARSVVSLCWNTLLGYRTLPKDPDSQLQDIVIVPKNPADQTTWTLTYEQLNQLLAYARGNGARYYSTQLFCNEPEIFLHYADKTEWRSSLHNFAPLELNHPGVAIKAAWQKNNNFFLSDGNNTYIFEGTLYRSSVFGSPFVTEPRLDQNTGICHVITCPYNGTGERELANLESFRFGEIQPVSRDGNILLTIHNNIRLLIYKKNNGTFTEVSRLDIPNLKSASLCDADQSISIQQQDGSKTLLPLIIETI